MSDTPGPDSSSPNRRPALKPFFGPGSRTAAPLLRRQPPAQGLSGVALATPVSVTAQPAVAALAPSALDVAQLAGHGSSVGTGHGAASTEREELPLANFEQSAAAIAEMDLSASPMVSDLTLVPEEEVDCTPPSGLDPIAAVSSRVELLGSVAPAAAEIDGERSEPDVHSVDLSWASRTPPMNPALESGTSSLQAENAAGVWDEGGETPGLPDSATIEGSTPTSPEADSLLGIDAAGVWSDGEETSGWPDSSTLEASTSTASDVGDRVELNASGVWNDGGDLSGWTASAVLDDANAATEPVASTPDPVLDLNHGAETGATDFTEVEGLDGPPADWVAPERPAVPQDSVASTDDVTVVDLLAPLRVDEATTVWSDLPPTPTWGVFDDSGDDAFGTAETMGPTDAAAGPAFAWESDGSWETPELSLRDDDGDADESEAEQAVENDRAPSSLDFDHHTGAATEWGGLAAGEADLDSLVARTDAQGRAVVVLEDLVRRVRSGQIVVQSGQGTSEESVLASILSCLLSHSR